MMIVVAGLVLGGLGWYYTRKNANSYERADKSSTKKLLGDFPVNDIAQITIRQSTNEVDLIKGDDWTVKQRADYPANASDIVKFARTLWDLRPAQSQKIGESQLGRLDLLPPDKGGTNSGTLVVFKDKDGKQIRSLLLGKQSMHSSDNSQFGGGWPNGRWLCLPDKPGMAYLVSETFSDIEPQPDHWLDKTFFKIQKPETIAVTFPEATNSWKLTRTNATASWQLADAKSEEKLDTSKASSVAYPFSSASFNDVAINPKAADTGLDKPTDIAVSTFDGFHYDVKIGAKTNNEYFLTVNVSADLPGERTPGKDEKPEEKAKLDKEFKETQDKLKDKLSQEKAYAKWTYLVPSWSVDQLLKHRSQLLEEKKKPEAAAKANTSSTTRPAVKTSSVVSTNLNTAAN